MKNDLTVDDSQIGEKKIDFLIEIYRQAFLQTRAYIDLRFKHFTTYIAIMALLAASLKSFDENLFKAIISANEVIISILFYLLDMRTGEYLKQQLSICSKIEFKFKTAFPKTFFLIDTCMPPKNKVRASLITKVLFYQFIIMWIVITIFFSVKKYNSTTFTNNQSFKYVRVN